jgi:pterin-4a-carbinolamine dehydratase
MLVNALGFVSEAADHHPDLTVTYKRVAVALSTHSAGGITAKDFELARKFDELATWRPRPGDALAGTTETFVRRS